MGAPIARGFQLKETDKKSATNDTRIKKNAFDISEGRVRTNPELIRKNVEFAQLNVSHPEDIEEMFSDFKRQNRSINNEHTKKLFDRLKKALEEYQVTKSNKDLPKGSFFWKKVKEDAKKNDNKALQIIDAWNTIGEDGCNNPSTKEVILYFSAYETSNGETDISDSGNEEEKSQSAIVESTSQEIKSTEESDAHESQTEISTRQKGSWDALLDKKWEKSKKFWDNGVKNSWSEDKAIIKVRNDNNKDEFKNMQDLGIPGNYIKNEKTEDTAYVPSKGYNAWTKILKAYGINTTEAKTFVTYISQGLPYKNWRRVAHFERPDVPVLTPTGEGNHQIPPDAVTDYFNTHFKNRIDLQGLNPKSLSRITGGEQKKAGKVRREISLPGDFSIPKGEPGAEMRRNVLINTPIIWTTNSTLGEKP